MEISIRPSKKSDIKKYTYLLQKTYQASHTSKRLGLTEECFSRKIFSTLDTQKYLKSSLVVNNKQKAWLAFAGSKLVGAITIIDSGNTCELRGFYTALNYQGRGIGKQLWEKALNFASGKDVVLDLYSHNTKTIGIYKKWGFVTDKKKGNFYRHWPEWPEGLKVKCHYMRYSGKLNRT